MLKSKIVMLFILLSACQCFAQNSNQDVSANIGINVDGGLNGRGNSVQQIYRSVDKETIVRRLFKSNKSSYMNSVDDLQHMVIRRDKNVCWIVLPEWKTYIEMPISYGLERMNQFDDLDDNCKVVSNDKRVPNIDITKQGYFNVKINCEKSGREYSGRMMISNVKQGHIPASIFEVPEDYKKVVIGQALKARFDKDYLSEKTSEDALIENLLTGSTSYSDVIEKLKALSPNNNVTADNLMLNNIIFNYLSGKIKILSEVIASADIFDKTSDFYIELTSKHKAITAIQQEIYSNSYATEHELFVKNTGYDLSLQTALPELLINPSWQPDSKMIYSLENMKSFQTHPDGVLMSVDSMYGVSKNAFLYTKENFVDGQKITGKFAFYSGTYKYKSLTGLRNIYAFKPYDLKKIQTAVSTFYFYPNIRDNAKSAKAKAYFDTILQSWNNHEKKVEIASDGLVLDIGSYDTTNNNLPVKITTKAGAVIPLNISATIPFQSAEAESFVQQSKGGLILPSATVKANGDILTVVLINKADNYSATLENGEFVPPAIQQRIKELKQAKLLEQQKIDKENQRKKIIEQTGFDFDELTARDIKSGLMWAKDGNLPGGKITWYAARDFAKKSNYAGYTDWRLPTNNELIALVEHCTSHLKFDYFNSIGFTNFQNGRYWSGTSARDMSIDSAYTVEMIGDLRLPNIKQYDNFMLMVRKAE